MQNLEELIEPLNRRIRKLGAWRKKWLSEKKRWNSWQRVMVTGEGLGQLTSIFETANKTIDSALNVVLPQLKAVLDIQEKGVTIEGDLEILSAEPDDLDSGEAA
ncbi:MAG: hypothetical protein JRL30_22715 [Deltaproteobacteria bacterium]|nr:hypothetical protein [Deltaproteobacteria bacterium]